MLSVKGKWALVTGASRGIGALVALQMAQLGCNLVLHSRKLAHSQAILQKVKALGVEVYAVEAELSNHQDVVNMLDNIEAKKTDIDIVFNNAAVQIAYRKDCWQTPVEDFEQSFRINFMSVATICYRLIPPMIERGFGRVVNTTSGIQNEPEQAGYSASKAALDKFTTDLATTLEGSDVLLNLTDPGWCRTDLGGDSAPNSPEDALPGVIVGAFIQKLNGRQFSADAFQGLTLQEAVDKAQQL